MKQDSFIHSVDYYLRQFLCQAGEGECVWPCVPGSAGFALQLSVLGMVFSCTELECSSAFVTVKTEKSYLFPTKETNEEKDS